MINILEYNYIFWYYLFFLLITNILIIYIMIIYKFYFNKKCDIFDILNNYISYSSKSNNDLIEGCYKNKDYYKNKIIFYYKLKKIHNLFSNHIKLNYQINQFCQEKKNKNYKNYKENLKNIKNNKKILKLYNKIIDKIKKNIKLNKNFNKIILHLLCVNF